MTLVDMEGLTEVAEDVYVRPMLTTNTAIDLYLGDLARSGKQDRTRDTYSRYLWKFQDMLPKDWDVAKVGPDDCRRFLDRYLGHSKGTKAQVESILNGFFRWLYQNEQIKRNPMLKIPRTRRLPQEALDVTTVSTEDVKRMLTAARGWTEKLSVALPAYMGCRRRAAADLLVKDYDQANRQLRFREKGGRTIWKPVPDQLAELIEARLSSSGDGAFVHCAGVGRPNPSPDDYLIPNESSSRRDGPRDDRVIWNAVKRVADRAGVDAHVHSLRAAFATYYLEQNPGDLEALQPLMGHRSIATTQVYLRRLNRESAMERVRGLTWA